MLFASNLDALQVISHALPKQVKSSGFQYTRKAIMELTVILSAYAQDAIYKACMCLDKPINYKIQFHTDIPLQSQQIQKLTLTNNAVFGLAVKKILYQ